MTKDQLFVRLANFLKQHCALVADTRDSNAPWNLLAALDRYEATHVRRTPRRRRR